MDVSTTLLNLLRASRSKRGSNNTAAVTQNVLVVETERVPPLDDDNASKVHEQPIAAERLTIETAVASALFGGLLAATMTAFDAYALGRFSEMPVVIIGVFCALWWSIVSRALLFQQMPKTAKAILDNDAVQSVRSLTINACLFTALAAVSRAFYGNAARSKMSSLGFSASAIGATIVLSTVSNFAVTFR